MKDYRSEYLKSLLGPAHKPLKVHPPAKSDVWTLLVLLALFALSIPVIHFYFVSRDCSWYAEHKVPLKDVPVNCIRELTK